MEVFCVCLVRLLHYHRFLTLHLDDGQKRPLRPLRAEMGGGGGRGVRLMTCTFPLQS